MKTRVKTRTVKGSLAALLVLLTVVAGLIVFGVPIVPMIALPILFAIFIYVLATSRREEERKDKSIKKVLIVDDDIDSKNILELALKNTGKHNVSWIGGNEWDAPEKLVNEQPDIVILDWKLGNGFLGSDLIAQANRMINSYEEFRERYKEFKPRVVTYSASDEPLKMRSPEHFEVIGHWPKGMSYEELQKHAQRLTEVS